MTEQPNASEGPLPGEHVLHRIAWFTLGFGSTGAAIAFAIHRPDWAKGIVCGTVLAWLNFRWLKRGMLAMVQSVSPNVASRSVAESPETVENRGDSRAPLRKRVCNCMKLLGLQGYDRKERTWAVCLS